MFRLYLVPTWTTYYEQKYLAIKNEFLKVLITRFIEFLAIGLD